MTEAKHVERPEETEVFPIAAILFGAAILVLGNGLQGTLIGVRASLEDFSPAVVGLMMSLFSVGYGIASLIGPYFLRSVGHIRTFAAFASILSASALVYLLMTQAVIWLGLRLIQGVCYGVMILVIETWLNSGTGSKDRGRVLSLYQGVLLLAWIVGQPLLNIGDGAAGVLFCLVSIILSLSLVPVTLAQVEQPVIVTPQPVSLKRIYCLSPIAFVGSIVCGISFTALVTMLAVFGVMAGYETFEISSLMMASLCGALLLQWPIGLWSDHVDRRIVLVFTAFASCVAAGAIAVAGTNSFWLLLGLTFVFGGVSVPSYPVCVAHINDFVLEDERIGTASALILGYSLGAVIGPLLAGAIMKHFGGVGLFWFLAVTQGAFMLFGLYRYNQRLAVVSEEKEEFAPLPRTTYASLALDERLGEVFED